MSKDAGKYIYNASLANLLAPSIGADETVKAVATALDPVLHSLARQAPRLLLWARLLATAGLQPGQHHAALDRITNAAGGLQKLDTATLEQLAWQLHVDFREAAQNDKQLAGLVVNSIPWHRIKGTPASLKAALELFGYTGVTIEEDGKGANWATYQLGLGGVADMATVRHIVEICNEMQPARCKLWRIWTPEYDWRAGDWNVKAWGEAWWSGVSGVESDLPGQDDEHGLIISFGTRKGFLSEMAYMTGLAGTAVESIMGYIAPYVDRPIWNWTNWGEPFPKNHGFVVGNLYSFNFSQRATRPIGWTGPWNGRHWLEWASGWDRPMPQWKMRVREYAKSQACWALPRVSTDEPAPSRYNDINANYGRPRAVTFKSPVWGDAWGAPTERQDVDILEQYHHTRGLTTSAVKPGAPRMAGHASMAVQPAGQLLTGRVQVAMQHRAAHTMTADSVAQNAPTVAIAGVVPVQAMPAAIPVPQTAQASLAAGKGDALHTQEWKGRQHSRRWYDYVGFVKTTAEEN